MNAHEFVNGRPVAVIGAGQVGAGWAIIFAQAGLSVRLFDTNGVVAEGALDRIADQLGTLHQQGLLDESPPSVLARVTVAATLAEAVQGVSYVQESVLERIDIKRALLVELDTLGGPEVIVGSSTSGLPASSFAGDLRITPRVLIAHPVNPPYLIPVVELVPSPETSAATVAFVTRLMELLGRSVVLVRKEVEGFIINRLQAVLLREAWALAEEGVASCEDIDKTVRDGLGLRWSFMGPFETIDLNAPGGIADYARRLGPLYRAIADSRHHRDPWSDELILEVEQQRRRMLTASLLPERRSWRDSRLMQIAGARKNETASRASRNS